MKYILGMFIKKDSKVTKLFYTKENDETLHLLNLNTKEIKDVLIPVRINEILEKDEIPYEYITDIEIYSSTTLINTLPILGDLTQFDNKPVICK